MRCKPAAVLDSAILTMIGYSPLTASCIFEFEDYEPDKVTISWSFVEDDDSLESENG